MYFTGGDVLLRVAILSKADSTGGGASRVAEHLTRAIDAHPSHHAIHINTWRKERFSFTVPLFGRSINTYFKLRKIEKSTGYVEILPIEYLRLRHILKKFKPDVLHFHDISSAFSPTTMKLLAKKYPVFWTFHDVSPVTGGCLYPGDCVRFESGCGGCPQLGTWPIDTQKDRTDFISSRKVELLESGVITTIAPSLWMRQLVSKRISKLPHIVYNGINQNIYKFENQSTVAEIRNELNLRPELLTIAWTCSDFEDQRKGVKEAILILNGLFKEVGSRFQIILIGNITQQVIDLLPEVPLYIAGYVFEETDKAKLLQCADVFLYTSLEDNQPLSVLEALSVGCSIVGFNTGGIPELSSHFGGALRLFPALDTNRVTSELTEICKSKLQLRPREEVSHISTKVLSQSVHLENHLEIYSKAIGQR